MILAINKSAGMTSHDVVQQLRRITGERRIGHAGTLDPLAEGVLVVGIGRESTRQLSTSVQAEKEYEATIRLGVTSTTDDDEGEKTTVSVAVPPERSVIEAALPAFVGTIQQTPPVYSAVKLAGQEAYKRVRRGEHVTMEPRTVEIRRVDLLAYDWPTLRIRLVTGKGVYIRAFARDLGERLGTGAYLDHLVRTRVGSFTRDQALTLEQYVAQFRQL